MHLLAHARPKGQGTAVKSGSVKLERAGKLGPKLEPKSGPKVEPSSSSLAGPSKQESASASSRTSCVKRQFLETKLEIAHMENKIEELEYPPLRFRRSFEPDYGVAPCTLDLVEPETPPMEGIEYAEASDDEISHGSVRHEVGSDAEE